MAGDVKVSDRDAGMFERGCSGREWQGKVLKGTLKGVIFFRGV